MKKVIILLDGFVYVFLHVTKKQKKSTLQPNRKVYTTLPDNPAKDFNDWANHISRINQLNLKK